MARAFILWRRRLSDLKSLAIYETVSNSWMRLMSGALFGIAAVWLAFPYIEAAFQETRETLEEKLKRSAFHPSPDAPRIPTGR